MSEYIERQKALDTVFRSHSVEAAHKFLAAIKPADVRPVEWTPVTERLPEEHVFVLIRQDDDRMMVAERVDGDWWYRYFAYDVDRWDENEQGTITHWMPLPEPPKEEA